MPFTTDSHVSHSIPPLFLKRLLPLSTPPTSLVSPMASTITSAMAMTNAKCMTNMSPKFTNTKLITSKPTSLLSLHNLPKGLTPTKPTDQNTTKPSSSSSSSAPIAGTGIAGAIFSTLATCDPSFAAKQIAETPEGDNRGLVLLIPVGLAIAWVLFNILQPALNQINRMRSDKGVIIGLGLGGLAAYSSSDASASEININGVIAEAAAASDNRGQLLLFVVAPAILWVLYNILQPALNQINRMRSQ